MPLEFTVANLDGIDENVKKLYKQLDDKSAFVLDVNGVVSKAEHDKLNEELATARKSAVGDDGRTYKEMFEGSQKANKAIRDERDAIKFELDGWKAFGNTNDVKAKLDELDGYKAKGEKLDEVTQLNITLKQNERTLQTQLDAMKAEKEKLVNANKELQAFKTDAEHKADIYDADLKITAVVEKMKEANQKALKSQLLDRYRMGDLMRAPNGDIVSKDDAMSLEDYAKDKMESYGLYAKNNPGFPPVDQGKNPPNDPGKGLSGVDALAAMFH